MQHFYSTERDIAILFVRGFSITHPDVALGSLRGVNGRHGRRFQDDKSRPVNLAASYLADAHPQKSGCFGVGGWIGFFLM